MRVVVVVGVVVCVWFMRLGVVVGTEIDRSKGGIVKAVDTFV